VYKGLDIATNKVTEEERLQCPHHFVDFASPNEEYTVVQFQKQALELVRQSDAEPVKAKAMP